MNWIIDRIENNLAILENETTKEKKEVPLSELPPSIHEGTILMLTNNQYTLNLDEEERKRKEILKRFQNLRNTH